tara:strand:- start:88 stop:957 length:870 start_codon:yes stop_codon:yes gene_type:complete
MTLGKQKFPIEIYYKLAKAFNELYKKKNIEKNISLEELYINDNKKNIDQDEDKKTKTAYLDEYKFYGRIGDIEEKVILNFTRPTSSTADLIKRFIRSTDATVKRQNKFAKKFYTSEETLQEILDNAEVNDLIDQLNILGVFIFQGLINFPIISYSAEQIEIDQYKIKSFPYINRYCVFLFTSDKEVDYYKFKYSFLQEIETLEKLNKEFPIKFNYQSKFLTQKLERSPLNDDHNEILDLLLKEYLKLETNKKFLDIIGDIVDLPFSFMPELNDAIPVMKEKNKNEEDEN